MCLRFYCFVVFVFHKFDFLASIRVKDFNCEQLLLFIWCVGEMRCGVWNEFGPIVFVHQILFSLHFESFDLDWRRRSSRCRMRAGPVPIFIINKGFLYSKAGEQQLRNTHMPCDSTHKRYSNEVIVLRVAPNHYLPPLSPFPSSLPIPAALQLNPVMFIIIKIAHTQN